MTTHDLLDNLIIGVRHLLDVLSYTVALGVLVQILPVTAAAMSILWLGIQMFTWFRRKGWQTDEEKARER
jgi:hypothetical protein